MNTETLFQTQMILLHTMFMLMEDSQEIFPFGFLTMTLNAKVEIRKHSAFALILRNKSSKTNWIKR